MLQFNKQKIFLHPFTMIISGATGSGKTEWLMRFLNNVNFLVEGAPFNKILYCYGEINENIIKLESSTNKNLKIQTYAGVPTEEFIQNQGKNILVVLDDLLLNIPSNFLNTLFTKGSHNWSVSVILVTQHLFSKELKVARNNSHYLVLMKNPAGALQVRNLGQQLFPTRTKYFMESYKDATTQKFSYLLIDMHPGSEENLRLKTYIYPDEGVTIIYVPKFS